MPIGKRIGAEFLGTFVLLLMGCGAAVLATTSPVVDVGNAGVAAAFGLAHLAMAFALGQVSGAHLNPAVTVGMALSRRFPAKDVGPYVLAQVAGGVLGAAVVFVVASGKTGFAAVNGFGDNGFGDRSPEGYSLLACAVVEVALTFALVFTVIGVSDRRSLHHVAPLAIGLAMVAAYMVAMPVDGASLNPARSTATAMFVGAASISQLWVFWAAPLAGGALAGLVYPMFSRVPAAAAVET